MKTGGGDRLQVTVMEMLRKESGILKELDHPNIVRYLGFEETPRYLTMFVLDPDYHCHHSLRLYSFLEYVPDGSVSNILRKEGRFNENVTRSFTSQILDGVDYLHSKGIIHRVRFSLCPLSLR